MTTLSTSRTWTERLGIHPILAVYVVLWACGPSAFLGWLRLTRLPGELWGYSLLLPAVGLLWALLGLVLLVTSGLGPRRLIRKHAWVPVAGGLGAAAFWVVMRIPNTVCVPFPAIERADALHLLDPAPGVDPPVSPIEIPGDGSYDSSGRFVREDEHRSRAAAAWLVPGFGTGGIELPRRPTTRYDIHGLDSLFATPVGNGWWYVYADF